MSTVDLGSFVLDEEAAREFIKAEHALWPDWNPLWHGSDPGLLLRIAQRYGFLRGPANLSAEYLKHADFELPRAHVLVAVFPPSYPGRLRIASEQRQWIVPDGADAPDAAMAVLRDARRDGNLLLRQAGDFTTQAETAAWNRGYEKASDEALDVTAGITAFGTCGCGDPLAFYDDQWFHVYNERLRGTDDHDPDPS